jgi:hypothetical protein
MKPTKIIVACINHGTNCIMDDINRCKVVSIV